MEKQNNIWVEDISILFSKYNFFEIIPLVNMSYKEKINAITRFSIYLSLLLILFTGNLNYLYLPLSIILLFYLMYIFKPNKEKFNDNETILDNTNDDESDFKEYNGISSANTMIEPKLDLAKCRNPTKNNPLMNLQLSDYTTNDNKRACDVNSQEISKQIDQSFDDKLYLNTEVIYNTKFNQRDFYTMPNTRNYNDQGSFANWLYNTPVSCSSGKEVELKQVRACSLNNKRMDEIELK